MTNFDKCQLKHDNADPEEPIECPECGEELNGNEDDCDCGWDDTKEEPYEPDWDAMNDMAPDCY